MISDFAAKGCSMDTKTQDKKTPRDEEQEQPRVKKKIETPQEFFDRVTARPDIHEIMTKLAKM